MDDKYNCRYKVQADVNYKTMLVCVHMGDELF